MSDDTQASGQPTWPPGGGEMARLVREFDWSTTPLGPAAGWSHALRTMTSILLANRFPMLLWWGPDSISIYNDAYIPVLGVKHPRALGQPVRECWSEIYDVLRPLIVTPLVGGPSTWSEDLELSIRRHGFLEETHWTVAYSPVPDETVATSIGGVLATVTEITAQVIGDRRNSLLHELGMTTAEAKSTESACAAATRVFEAYAKDVAFALVYLLDEDGRTARLVSTTRVTHDTPGCPSAVALTPPSTQGETLEPANGEGFAVSLGAASDPWRVAHAVGGKRTQLIETTAWPDGVVSSFVESPVRAFSIPLESGLPRRPAGVLVLGASPLLPFNASYRGFAELVASQLFKSIANTRAYEAERQRAEELAILDRAKTTFFSNVSHELRTPLTLMLGPLQELLEGNAPTPEAQHAQLEIAHRNAQRLLKLVNSLLDFSRIEAGRSRARFQPTDVGSLTTELASSFRSLVEKAGVVLSIDSPPLRAPVWVDPDMWEKIVFNLLSNAFKHTLEGTISVRVEADEHELCLSVSDTGTGIDARHLPHVFERFYRVEDARGRSSEGTGIGLALVRELTRLHGGSVDVQSERGKGTTFSVKIPTARVNLPLAETNTPSSVASEGVLPFLREANGWVRETALASEQKDAALREPLSGSALTFAAHNFKAHNFKAQSGPAPAVRLLVADDNADMRLYLERLLRPLGTVQLVNDGRQALAAIAHEMPDLVLSDVMMPNIDGLELVRILRNDPYTTTLPIILLSARAGEESRFEGANEGADDYIVKPFVARELVARVKTQLQLSQARREHAKALEASEERFRALVTASSDVVYRMSPDWSEMLELVGRDFIADTADRSRTWLQRYIHPDDQPRLLEVIAEAIRNKRVFELEHRVLRVDGSFAWTFSRAVPLFDAAGNIVEWFGAARDVTARKQTQEALRESEERYRTLFESIDEGFCIVEVVLDEQENPVDYRFLEMNPAGMAQMGLHNPKGRTIRQMVPQHEERWFELYGEIARTGEPARFEQEAKHLEPPRWFDVYAFRYGAPEKRQVAVLFNDIASRKRVEESLRQVNLELAEADQRKNEFLAVLSHELRNPLAPIVNSLYILDHSPPGGPQGERAKQIIGRQVTQLSNLVNDLLDVTRITRNKVRLQCERISLGEVVQRAVEDHRVLFERVAVQLEFVPASGPVPVFADGTRVSQVVGNLLQNAAKFTTKGNTTSVTLAVEGKEAVVRVEDDGIGIAPDTLERLFEPFAQAAQTLDRTKGGLGIGLSLVKGLVELHGGSVAAHSQGLDKGTRIVVRLPLDETAAVAPVSQTNPLVSTPRRRVLIIEDNVDAADTLCEMLELCQHEVAVAYDGREGVAKALAFLPDVVLCDIGLPGMDGYEVARALLADTRLVGTSVIALSGYALPEDLERAASAGFHRHLTKPPNFKKLEALLSKLPARAPEAETPSDDGWDERITLADATGASDGSLRPE